MVETIRGIRYRVVLVVSFDSKDRELRYTMMVPE